MRAEIDFQSKVYEFGTLRLGGLAGTGVDGVDGSATRVSSWMMEKGLGVLVKYESSPDEIRVMRCGVESVATVEEEDAADASADSNGLIAGLGEGMTTAGDWRGNTDAEVVVDVPVR